MSKIAKIQWITTLLTTGYAINALYQKGRLVYVNVPYFSEIASANDVDMKKWMYTTGSEVAIFSIAALILVAILAITASEVWLSKPVPVEQPKKEKVKGKPKPQPKEPEIIRFD